MPTNDEKEKLLPCPPFDEDDFFETIKHYLLEHCGDVMIGEIAEAVAKRANSTLMLRLKLANDTRPSPVGKMDREKLARELFIMFADRYDK